jgi:diguanylate cyclase (GGDEF)-like protein
MFSFNSYVLHKEPFPSLADGFYLAGYPVLIAGLFILIQGRTSRRDQAGLLDACIIATGLGLLSWTFLMRPITADDSLTVFSRMIALAYPAADVLMLAMVARLLFTPGARTASYRLLVAALLLLSGGDVGYAAITTLSDYNGGLIAGTWLLSYVLGAAAALHPSMRSLSEVSPNPVTVRFTRTRLALLAGTSLLAPALLLGQGLHDPHTVDWAGIGLGAVVLFLLVLTRMSGLVSQIQDQAAQLATLAHNDGLTGVANRRAWDLELAREMSMARRTGKKLTVALLDLDNFKRFNDQRGHQAGDRLLSEAAALWKAQLREHDFIARYGGEEFALTLADLPPAEAVSIVERLLGVTPDGQTFSAGVACWDGYETPQHLVARADEALYHAKHAGRNRVILAVQIDRPPVVVVQGASDVRFA